MNATTSKLQLVQDVELFKYLVINSSNVKAKLPLFFHCWMANEPLSSKSCLFANISDPDWSNEIKAKSLMFSKVVDIKLGPNRHIRLILSGIDMVGGKTVGVLRPHVHAELDIDLNSKKCCGKIKFYPGIVETNPRPALPKDPKLFLQTVFVQLQSHAVLTTSELCDGIKTHFGGREYEPRRIWPFQRMMVEYGIANLVEDLPQNMVTSANMTIAQFTEYFGRLLPEPITGYPLAQVLGNSFRRKALAGTYTKVISLFDLVPGDFTVFKVLEEIKRVRAKWHFGKIISRDIAAELLRKTMFYDDGRLNMPYGCLAICSFDITNGPIMGIYCDFLKGPRIVIAKYVPGQHYSTSGFSPSSAVDQPSDVPDTQTDLLPILHPLGVPFTDHNGGEVNTAGELRLGYHAFFGDEKCPELDSAWEYKGVCSNDSYMRTLLTGTRFLSTDNIPTMAKGVLVITSVEDGDVKGLFMSLGGELWNMKLRDKPIRSRPIVASEIGKLFIRPGVGSITSRKALERGDCAVFGDSDQKVLQQAWFPVRRVLPHDVIRLLSGTPFLQEPYKIKMKYCAFVITKNDGKVTEGILYGTNFQYWLYRNRNLSSGAQSSTVVQSGGPGSFKPEAR